ncbi:rhomboid family intramembrane serine protease [soil metagenome]
MTAGDGRFSGDPATVNAVETAVDTCYRHPDQPAGVVCQRCDRPICPQCMHQASVGFHCPECVKMGKQKVYQGVGSLQTRPVLTQVLIGINVAIFVVAAILDGGDSLGGSRGQVHLDFGLIAKASTGTELIGVGFGEWYRLVSSGFLHYGIFHLGVNMFALWILGNSLEGYGGRLRFGVLYGLSIVGGSVGALVLSPSALTAGASGGIYGLLGAIFMVQRSQGIPFRQSPLLGILLLNLVITFGVPGISIGGHLGGLAAGALTAFILFDYGPRAPDKRMALLACGALALLLLGGGILFAETWMPT